jgi:hypothetical protein
MRTRRTLLAAAAALIVLPPGAKSDEPVAPADDEFLEFLGAADSDDTEWNEYLESVDLDAEIGRSKARTETQPAAGTVPAGKGKEKVTGDGA